MSEKEFLDITPRSFNNKLIGARRKEEALNREAWEQTRALGVLLISPNLKKGTKADPQRLWPFPWDKEKRNVEDPAEAFKRSKALWAEIDRKRAEAKKNNID